MFIGTYFKQLDNYNRVALPKGLASSRGRTMYIVRVIEHVPALEFFDEHDFDWSASASKLSKIYRLQYNHPRIILNKQLREIAKIDSHGKIAIVGRGKSFILCAEANYHNLTEKNGDTSSLHEHDGVHHAEPNVSLADDVKPKQVDHPELKFVVPAETDQERIPVEGTMLANVGLAITESNRSIDIKTRRSSSQRSTLARPRNVLRRSALFARLTDEETDTVLAHSRTVKYKAGEQIVAKGDPGDSMMAVLSGRVSVDAPSPDGRQVMLSEFHVGDLFGEIALLDGKERNSDVTALTDCEILIVPRRSLWSLIERRPDICIDLLLVLCERLRHTTEQVEDLAFLPLESRMAKVLLRLLEESGGSLTRAGPTSVRISQRALGERVGGSRESVNKHLNAWKEMGIISIEKGAIVIRDIDALAEYAQ